MNYTRATQSYYLRLNNAILCLCDKIGCYNILWFKMKEEQSDKEEREYI